jgi:hypothetical protein
MELNRLEEMGLLYPMVWIADVASSTLIDSRRMTVSTGRHGKSHGVIIMHKPDARLLEILRYRPLCSIITFNFRDRRLPVFVATIIRSRRRVILKRQCGRPGIDRRSRSVISARWSRRGRRFRSTRDRNDAMRSKRAACRPQLIIAELDSGITTAEQNVDVVLQGNSVVPFEP